MKQMLLPWEENLNTARFLIRTILIGKGDDESYSKLRRKLSKYNSRLNRNSMGTISIKGLMAFEEANESFWQTVHRLQQLAEQFKQDGCRFNYTIYDFGD